ncbi:MAG: hypothetical protein RJB66_344 [Pseudomonadota bacterium]|jgi:hypothetical protein
MKETKLILIFITLFLLFLGGEKAFAEKKKIQEINFSEMDVQGSARTPDGTYLVQRRGLRFLPLYDVKRDLDQKIRKSTSYLK